MCCVIITAGQSGRQVHQHLACVASVPPVEAPMKIELLGRQPAQAAGACCTGLAGAASACTGGPAPAPPGACTRALRRGADLLGDVGAQLAQAVGHADLGLGDEIHRAQFQRACSVTSAPRSVNVDTITTGIGRRRIRLATRKSMPSMRGISTSSVITSGLSVADHLARHVAGRRRRRCSSMSGLAVDDLRRAGRAPGLNRPPRSRGSWS